MLRVTLLLSLAYLSQSCLSASSWQTAESLKAGEGRVIIATGNYTSPSFSQSLEDAQKESEETTGTSLEIDTDDLAVPFIEFGYTYGFTDSFDMGAKLTLPGNLTIDTKYNLIDTDPFDFALGLSYGIMSYESTSTDLSGNETKSESSTSDIIVPLYTSFRLGFVALYLVPKYIMRTIEIDGESASTTYTGGSVGLAFGRDWGLMVEGTYLQQADSDFDIMQTGIAIFF